MYNLSFIFKKRNIIYYIEPISKSKSLIVFEKEVFELRLLDSGNKYNSSFYTPCSTLFKYSKIEIVFPNLGGNDNKNKSLVNFPFQILHLFVDIIDKIRCILIIKI